MRFLKIALFLCAVIGPLERAFAVTNDCVGPPPSYNNSIYQDCVANQPTGGCKCNDTGKTCSYGDRLNYKCDHGIDLDFTIVCDVKDAQDLRFFSSRDTIDKFEACTGSEAPVPPPQPTFPLSDCSKFNVATWPPEGCIRLVGNETTSNETTGILQVHFNNTWGSVCYTSTWNQPTIVDIACRMLGFKSHGSPAVQVPTYQLPPNVSDDAWAVNIQHNCLDTVNTLWECDRTEVCWLTYAVGGSGQCPSLLNISCEVNTTFPNLMSCQPPTTTIPNPTTSGPDVATEDSLTEKNPTASGHESSPGFSTGGIVAIVVGAIAGVVLLALVASKLCCKRNNRNNRRRGNAAAHNSQRRAQPPPVRETNEQSSDYNPTSGEPAQLQEMRQVGEASDERLCIEVKDGTSGTAANQTSTDPGCSQPTGEPSASEPSAQTDSPKRPGSAMTPIDS